MSRRAVTMLAAVIVVLGCAGAAAGATALAGSAELGVRFAVALLYGILAGNFLRAQLAQVPLQRPLGARDYVLIQRGMETHFGPLVPPAVFVADVLPLAQLALSRAFSLGEVLCFVADGAMIVATIITLAINAPVNDRSVAWDPERPPDDWQAQRDRWNLGQTLRTPFALIAFVAALAALVTP